MTDRLVEAGLTLIVESYTFAGAPVARAKGIRNGLMIALLAVCPIRLKNFAALEIGRTFREIEGSWWIVLPAETKSRRADERRVPALPQTLHRRLSVGCPTGADAPKRADARRYGSRQSAARPMIKKAVGTLVSKITFETLGVDVSPHLFRTAAASTAATYGGSQPHLARALLNHTDPRITEEHYNRATSMSAAETYAEIVRKYDRA